MELRRMADALLRFQASPLASFLTPSVTARWPGGKQFSCRGSSATHIHRSFSIMTKRCAIRPPVTTLASAAEPRNETTEGKDNKVESLGWTSSGVGKPGSNGSPSSKPGQGKGSAWPYRNRTKEQELLMNGGTTADDLLKAINDRRNNIKRPSSDLDFSRMLDPSSSRSGVLGLMHAVDSEMMMPKPEKIPMRLNPSSGRSITMTSGIDVGRGFRLLEQSCSRNKVRLDAKMQRFHERGGLKRKRLRRERWRKMFMKSFKAAISRVKELKHQGW